MNASLLSINTTSIASASASDSIVVSSSPPKPAPSTTTRVLVVVMSPLRSGGHRLDIRQSGREEDRSGTRLIVHQTPAGRIAATWRPHEGHGHVLVPDRQRQCGHSQ